MDSLSARHHSAFLCLHIWNTSRKGYESRHRTGFMRRIFACMEWRFENLSPCITQAGQAGRKCDIPRGRTLGYYSSIPPMRIKRLILKHFNSPCKLLTPEMMIGHRNLQAESIPDNRYCASACAMPCLIKMSYCLLQEHGKTFIIERNPLCEANRTVVLRLKSK